MSSITVARPSTWFGRSEGRGVHDPCDSRLRRIGTTALGVLLAASMVAPATAQRHNTVSFEEGEEGWYPLFDGRSLDGLAATGDGDWQVRDGEIVAEKGGMSLLMTEETFSDFELKVDFLAAPGANSGIFLRVTSKDPAAGGGQAYELNIAPPGHTFPTGSLMRVEMAAGGAPKFGVTQKVESAGESDDWRTFHVVARGGHFTVELDGEKIVELDDPAPIAEGFLALQHNQGRVAFRNLKVRRLRL